MGDAISWVLELNIKDGKFDAFETLMDRGQIEAHISAGDPAKIDKHALKAPWHGW